MSNTARQLAASSTAGPASRAGHAPDHPVQPNHAFAEQLGFFRLAAAKLPSPTFPQPAGKVPLANPKAEVGVPPRMNVSLPAAAPVTGHKQITGLEAHRVAPRGMKSSQGPQEMSVAAGMPAPTEHALTATVPAASPPPAHVRHAIEQVGRVTAVNQLTDGRFEFRLVLPAGSLAGAEIHVVTAGPNRVTLGVRRARGRIGDDELSDLVQRMRNSGVTVVATEFD